ncbi:OsmC family protein [Taklimakanibacter lacteus]|uniref:OsmC family protein n=1 Tax=Taklimakanibacter lacteus TaxID=2268456 RepID=UPI0013C4B05D
MHRDAQIRAAQERVADIFRKKPTAAFSSTRASGHVGEGLVCTVRQGDREAVADMPPVLGGGGSAPTPGFFIRVGLASCVAIGIKLTAAREDIALAAVDVDVDMDFDDSALLGLGDNTAAPLETRFTITLATAAPWPEVTAMVERALAADPFFIALRDAQNVKVATVAGAK